MVDDRTPASDDRTDATHRCPSDWSCWPDNRIVHAVIPALPRKRRLQHYSVYGVTLCSDFSFRWPLVPAPPPADVAFSCTMAAPTAVDWAAVPAVHDVWSEPSRELPDVTYHRASDLDVVRIRDVADHYVRRDRIDCHLLDPDLAYLAEIQLLGMVMALWLERRTTPTLHASSVVVDGVAVAFLGTKGGGKTTAAAAMLAAGHAFLTDDLLALTLRDDAVLAQPGYPMVRLWPDQIDHFVGTGRDLPLVHPAFSKRRVPVGTTFGMFQPTATRLRRVYLPSRRRAGGVSIEPLRGSEALLELVRHSFLREAVHGLGLAPVRFRLLAGVLQTVGVRVLRYPDGFAHLPEVVAAIEHDVTEG